MTSVRCGIRRLRLRLAARIAGGQLWLYEGCKPSREWVKGEIIVTPEGFAAMRAAFWTGATTRAHTALSTPNAGGEGRDGVAYLSTTLFNFRINQQLGE